jgi:cytochrome c oxidase cbb3-type subunit 3
MSTPNSSETLEPIERPDGPVLDHAYDGIREYDNPLPGWWTWMFVATIVFACVYFYIDMTTDELTGVYAYDQAVIDDTQRQFGKLDLKPDAPSKFRVKISSVMEF